MNILDQNVLIEWFRTFYPFFIGLIFMISFAMTWYVIPKVLWVSKEKNLVTGVNSRSSHANEIPSFGGVAFYITLILLLTILQTLRLNFVGNHLIAALTILFMVGLKDDLVISTARAKLIGQISAACFIVFSPEMHLTTLYGFLGIYEIPFWLGVLLTGLLVVAIINAYNLIDGIDGLAAMVGIVVCSCFAGVFYITKHPYNVLLSVSMVGILLAFLRYNFFSRGERKMFMGDSGSLIVGLIISFLTVQFLVMNPDPELIKDGFATADRPLVILGILFIPIFDTLRVMVIRLRKGTSPFSADRNHIHHVLLDLGFTHFQVSGILSVINFLIILLYYNLAQILSSFYLILAILGLYFIAFILFYQLKFISRNTRKYSRTTKIYQDE